MYEFYIIFVILQWLSDSAKETCTGNKPFTLWEVFSALGFVIVFIESIVFGCHVWLAER